MDKTYVTSDGDILDTLCFHHYGAVAGAVESVLATNAGLADHPQPFKAGVSMRLPTLTPPAQSAIVHLWD